MRKIAFLLALSLPAAADEIQLKGGGKIEGIVKSEGDKIVVETGLGDVAFDAKDVASVTKGRAKLHEYYEKAEKAKSAAELFDLAQWAKSNGCPKFWKPLLDQVIAKEPDQEAARRGLGFELHKGKWMTKDEIRRDLGYVEFEGRWISKEERDLIVAQRESARLDREQRRAEAKRREVEVEKTVSVIGPYIQRAPRRYYEPYYDDYTYPYYRPYYYSPFYAPTYSPYGVPYIPSTPALGAGSGTPFWTTGIRVPWAPFNGYGHQIP